MRILLALALLPAVCTAQTLTFGPRVPLTTSSAFESDVALAVDPSGTSHVLYRMNDGDPEIHCLADPGGSWGAPVRLTDNIVDDLFVLAAPLASGEAVAAWQTRERDFEVVCQRLAGGVPVGPLINVTDNEDGDDILGLAAAGPSRWIVLTIHEAPEADELVLHEVQTDGAVTHHVIALALGQRFLGGFAAVGPDGVIHVAVRIAALKAGSVPRVDYTNNHGGAFSPLWTVLPDASAADLGFHVDGAGLVYVHARSLVGSVVKISSDGGATFPAQLDLGSFDVQQVVGRPDGVDVFELVSIDSLMRLHRIMGTALGDVLDVPTPGWRAGDIQFRNGTHFAITTGTLQFTSTQPGNPLQAGDLDLNGRVDSADVVWLVNALAGQVTLTLARLLNADVNGDLVIDAADLSALLGILLGQGSVTQVSS